MDDESGKGRSMEGCRWIAGVEDLSLGSFRRGGQEDCSKIDGRGEVV